MSDPLYGNTNFNKILPAITYRSPGVSYNVPSLNVSTINGAAAGSGGGVLTPNISVSTLSLCAPGVGQKKGLIQFAPVDGEPLFQTLGLQAWGDETDDRFQITLNNIGGTADYLGCKGILATEFINTTGQPFGIVEASADGVVIMGADATGKITQTWYEAHSGFNKVNCVSTLTDSQKTGTLDFSAFLSTMASVYPEIVKPYS